MGYNGYTFHDHIKYGSSHFKARAADFFGAGLVDASGFGLTYPATPNMTVQVTTAGVAWADGGRSSYDGATPVTLTFAANSSGNPRIDLVQVGPVAVPSVLAGLNQDLAQVTVKQGTPAGSPVRPSPDTGCVGLYAVAVANGATSITAGNVTDLRAPVATSLGRASAETPPGGDSSVRVPTTAWVAGAIAALGLRFNTEYGVTANATLTSGHLGGLIVLGGSTNYTVTLPAASACSPGTVLYLWQSKGSGYVTVQRAGADVIAYQNPVTYTSVQTGPGDTLVLVSNGTDQWWAVGGSLQLGGAAAFARATGTPGYQKLPGGIIIQWLNTGTISGGGAHITVTYPVAFPNMTMIAVATYSGNQNAPASVANGTTTGLDVYNWGSVAGAFDVIAIGV